MAENYDSDVGSTYPGAGEGPKGLAVRQLKSYASWVQTVQKKGFMIYDLRFMKIKICS